MSFTMLNRDAGAAMTKCAGSLALFIALVPQATAQDLTAFDYEATPLAIEEKSVENHGDIQVRDITYASPKGGAVPAYEAGFQVSPEGSG